jgi:predicted nucleic acid-binding Zn ribbon protein
MNGTDNRQTRVVFWFWLAIIGLGLAVMIVLPLAGR